MAKYRETPSREYLLTRFDYDPETGSLKWKPETASAKVRGKEAGNVTNYGYRAVLIDFTKYMVHRIIWRIMTGEDPGELQIDHIDGNKLNNRFSNLRLATNTENSCNSRRVSKTGYKGVRELNGRYTAQIKVNKQWTFIGSFDTPEQAHAAYKEVAALMHGEFACVESKLRAVADSTPTRT